MTLYYSLWDLAAVMTDLIVLIFVRFVSSASYDAGLLDEKLCWLYINLGDIQTNRVNHVCSNCMKLFAYFIIKSNENSTSTSTMSKDSDI